jgi:mono/diheme cytochrome c family protein
MNRSTLIAFMLFSEAIGAQALAADGIVVPAYQRFRADHLNSVDAGRLLISELNCQSCHGTFAGEVLPPRQAPILTKVGERTSAEYLQKFIHDPQALKPGTAMPGIPKLKSDAATAAAIAAFLTQGTSWRPAGVSFGAVRRGEVLFHSVGCAACHGDQRDVAAIEAIRKGLAPPPEHLDEEEDTPARKVASDAGYATPDFAMPLGKLDDKYTLSSLITFLQDPHAVRPSGRMPALNLKPEEARDIASYLLKNVKVKANIHFDHYEGDWGSVPDFSQLTPTDSGETTDFSVSASPKTEAFGLRFTGFLQIPTAGDFRFFLSSDDGSKLLIDGKVVVDNDGVHPAGYRDGVATLKAGPHDVVVEYFEAGGQEELAVEIEGPNMPRQPMAGFVTLTQEAVTAAEDPATAASPELIEQGRQAFASLGCAACHQFGEGEQRIAWTGKAPQFADLKTSGGCLAEQPAASVPNFAMSPLQRDDITAAILASRGPNAGPNVASARSEISQIMLTMNCYACHARGSIGGVSEPMTHVFVGSIPEMGDEGRVPPALDGAGDKLNEAWLKTILNDGAKDRPYMQTRMPKFGNALADALVPRLIASDLQESVFPVVMPEADHRVKADARLMVGDQALSCIKCHTFEKYAATGIQSLDMTTMTRRLRRDWFHRYMLNPQQYRPGTRMPAAWPNGRSVVPDILGSEAGVQIEAIWQYLLDGDRAKIPSGLMREAIELIPADRPIIYRNFLEGLSPRGIAVGFPEQAHFAWDAEHMTPRLIWHGAFIDASKHWVDRGPGNQSPLGDHVMTLPAGPPIATLISLDEPWPDKSPRENGFHFKGYLLDAGGVPGFRYQWNDVSVTDSLQPFMASPDNGLQRTVIVTSSERMEHVYLRIVAGSKIEAVDGAFVTNGMKLMFDACEPVIRTIDSRQELLVPVRLRPDGKATVRYTIVW